MKTIIAFLALCCLLVFGLTGCQSTNVTSAKIYLQQNDLDSAQEQLELGLQRNPNNAQAHFLLGQVHSQRKSYAKMLKESDASLTQSQKYKQEIESIEQKHIRDLYSSAVERFNGGQIEQAIIDLKTLTMIDPNDQEAWALLGKSYIRIEQTEDAVTALEKAALLDPKYEKIDDRVLLMKIYYDEERYPEALNLAMEIIRQDSANKDAVRVAAFCYNQLGQKDKAFEYYQKVMKDQPDDPDLIFNLGLLHEEMEDYDKAIVQFRKAFELNPQDTESILHCAQLYMEIKEDNLKAIECFESALEADPDNAGIWNNLGIAQIRAGEELDDQSLIDKGTASIKKAIELRGENP